MKLCKMKLLLVISHLLASSKASRTYQDVIKEDGSYYTMSLYQENAEGMFDRHHVHMEGTSVVHDFLSTHSQAAEAIDPGFHFPFYGHLVDSFYVTTHGFLSFAPGLHNLMYKTQYIAPLRVKLDPARFNDSTINYLLTEEALTIQWTNVTVSEPLEHEDGGRFTFQVSLHPSGKIVFVYVDIPPLLTSDALYDNQPVAGLSDAFLVGDAELHVYHTLNVDNIDIRSKTVVIFHPKPTCIVQRHCKDCLDLASNSAFQCSWCPAVQRCSDGADRLREDWDANGCGSGGNTTDHSTCELISANGNHIGRRRSMIQEDEEATPESTLLAESSGDSSTTISAVISVILVLILLALITAFTYVYGRNNPGSVAERIAMRLEANYKRFGGAKDPVGTAEDGEGHGKANPMCDINLNTTTADVNGNTDQKIQYENGNSTVKF